MDRPWFTFYEEGVPRNLTYPDSTLNTLLLDTVQKYPENTATNFVLKYMFGDRFVVGGKLTYRQFNDLVDRCATALYQLGVRKGDRVAVMLPNSPHFMITFFATMRLGAIIVNVNPTYTSRELKYQLEDCGAETMVLLNLFWPRLREVQSATAVKRVIVAHIFDTLPFPAKLLVRLSQRRSSDWVTVRPEHDIFYFSHLLEKYSPTPPRIEVTPDDVALFQYTGGTTGQPKAAMLTHRNMMANTWQVKTWLADLHVSRERIMDAIPFFHVYGIVAMLMGVVTANEAVVIPNPRPIDNVMHIIQKERCTYFPGVPAMYIAIVNHPNVQKYDLTSVRSCVSGSAPLPMDVQEKFGQLTGGRLVEGYGLTEAAPVTHCNPINGTRKAGSIGIPIPDVDAKLIDLDTGVDLPLDTDQRGELCVRGPQIMTGYWNAPDDTSVTLTEDGWLHTGDICKIDADGFFYVVDRRKDMIIASGFKVLPRDVEEVLFMHPKVQEAVVAGIPHPTRGDDTVKAYIVPRSGPSPTVEEIKEFCKLHLAPYKVPREIEFREELPKTAVGKVLRRILVEEELSRRAAGDGTANTSGASSPSRQQPARA
jgi:long-chain acyl-CoA synthetase